MRDLSTKWYYESDGDENRRTHYLCNEAMDARIDCYTKRDAIQTRDALNAPMLAGETMSAHIVKLLREKWLNLNIEGWDDEAAEYIIRTALAKNCDTLQKD